MLLLESDNGLYQIALIIIGLFLFVYNMNHVLSVIESAISMKYKLML